MNRYAVHLVLMVGVRVRRAIVKAILMREESAATPSLFSQNTS